MVERGCDLKSLDQGEGNAKTFNAEAKRGRLSADQFHVLQVH